MRVWPRLQQILRRQLPALDVVIAETGPRSIFKLVQPDKRNVGAVQQIDLLFRELQVNDQQALYKPGLRHEADAFIETGEGADVVEDDLEVIALLAQALLDAAQALDEGVVIDERLSNDPDVPGVGFPGKLPGHRVRLELQHRHRGLDPFPSLWADIGTVIKHTRDGSNTDTGFLSHIQNSWAGHRLGLLCNFDEVML